MLSGELGVSQAFLSCWYISGGYMDVSEMVVFMTVAKYTSRTVSLVFLYIHFCDLKMAHSGRNMSLSAQ
jgi:hypothetical protein